MLIACETNDSVPLISINLIAIYLGYVLVLQRHLSNSLQIYKSIFEFDNRSEFSSNVKRTKEL
jgi:hypothetical protein